MGEVKELVLMDQVVAGGAGTVRGPVVHVDGGLLHIDLEAGALGAGGTFTLNGGPGKADLNTPVLGLLAAGETDISAFALTTAVAARWRVLGAPKYVQVAIAQGATGARVRVTAQVEVDQG